MTAARDVVLARIRAAIANVGPVAVERTYNRDEPAADVARFVERVRDYRARVIRCSPAQCPTAIDATLHASGVTQVVVPTGLAARWWPTSTPVITDDGTTTVETLDGDGLAVVTTCSVAIAETGTIILDGSAGQGRRLLTLVPDRHVCIVPIDRIVATVPAAVRRLDPTRPLTWISGPSATSDIELHRVEGVHGPRQLTVVILGE